MLWLFVGCMPFFDDSGAPRADARLGKISKTCPEKTRQDIPCHSMSSRDMI